MQPSASDLWYGHGSEAPSMQPDDRLMQIHAHPSYAGTKTVRHLYEVTKDPSCCHLSSSTGPPAHVSQSPSLQAEHKHVSIDRAPEMCQASLDVQLGPCS